MWPFKKKPTVDVETFVLREKLVKANQDLLETLTKQITILEDNQALANSHISLLEVFERLNNASRNDLTMSDHDRETINVILDEARSSIKLHCKHKKWVKTDRADAMFPGDWHYKCETCGKYDYE